MRGRIFRLGIFLTALIVLLLTLDHLYPAKLSRAQSHSALVLDNTGHLLRGFTTADDTWRLPLSPAEVDPLYLQMLVAYEDRRFYGHPGVDPLALLRAGGQWLVNGKIISGASTLTMQTARLLEPGTPTRSLTAKVQQMLRALQLEWHYSKQQILEFYLALAPYSGNLEGLRAASWAYLGKEPQRLTAAEAALLVVLPQQPSGLRPDRFTDKAKRARDKVLQRMAEVGLMTPPQVAEALLEAIPSQRRRLPFHAPHLARKLRADNPKQHEYRTFIQRSLQQTLEAMAQRELNGLDKKATLAVLVVENQTRKVITYIGAADFFAGGRAGQVDMVSAVRSPGSTLKPIVYGLGFDDLIIHPETLIDDVPTRFGDYQPSNFLNQYHGQVSVRTALQESLNIPAVAVLERVGPGRVAARLKQVGTDLVWTKVHTRPGLPLVLGGVGTSLKDLVTLYVGIANNGEVKPLRFSDSDVAERQARYLFSAAASWYLRDILKRAPPPKGVVPAVNQEQSRAIAYKTGTSYGFRDAWAIGFDQHYTVGVWVGRPDGAPSPDHYGRKTAAPVLFQVFDLLPSIAPSSDQPPVGVLLAERSQLPPRLREFRRPTVLGMMTQSPLQITFPIDGSRLQLPQSQSDAKLPLIASGGRKPLRWLVNGEPIAGTKRSRKSFAAIDGAGYARITVIDSAGQSADVAVWIEME